MNDIEYLVFPRLLGYAELAWTGGPRTWDEYKVCLGKHAPRFDALEIDYYKSPKIPWAEKVIDVPGRSSFTQRT